VELALGIAILEHCLLTLKMKDSAMYSVLLTGTNAAH
jgi:hypothetical protein